MHLADIIKTGYLDFSDVEIGVIGDCMLDIYHYGTVDRISPEAPVPIFKANNTEPEYRLGGACNTAANLKKLGVKTHLFGFIGKDPNASYIKSYLSEYEINFCLVDLFDFPTITKNRYFSNNQQIIRIDQENTDGEIYDPERKDILIKRFMEVCNKFDAIIISDYGKGCLYNPVLNSIMSYCSDTPIFVDPKISDWGHYSNAFCITPNKKEFYEAAKIRNDYPFDSQDISLYASNLCMRHNIKHILITLGSEGMVMIDRSGYWIGQGTNVEEVYDVSGAGDTVIATLAAAYCKNYPMSIAMQLATMAAKVVIGHLGTYAVNNSELERELFKMINEKVEC